MADDDRTAEDRPQARPAPVSPQKLERYKVGDEIARGGMGRVVEATDTVLQRSVAIKQVLDVGDHALKRFERETLITARLEHPSIVPLYDAGRGPDGLPFYVMRKVAGRPLVEIIKETWDERERLALIPHVLSASEAVAHAHRRNVIHRDLKPSNILVGELGEIIVIDWGLAKVIDEPDVVGPSEPSPNTSLRTELGTSMGTPGYMAPEQLEGDPQTPAADVYALGATLYHVVAGKPPHHAPNGEGMRARALAGPPAPLSSIAPGVPDELATIIDKALAYDRAVRYPDAGALVDDLRRFLTGRLVGAHRYTVRERVWRFVRRHRAAVVTSLLGLAIIAVISVLAIRSILDARDEAVREKETAEHWQRREAARADELALEQARAIAGVNPIGAIGLTRQIPAESPLWRKARNIVAHASAIGVPWVLPGAKSPTSLVMTDDGKTAYSGGLDGTVWQHDLVARSSRMILQGADRIQLELTDRDRTLVIADRASLKLVALGTLVVSNVEIPAPIVALDADTDRIAWVDHAGAVWLVRRPATSPISVPTPIKPVRLTLSPGAHLAVANPQGVAVIDLETSRVAIQHTGFVNGWAWSSDGKRLGLAGEPGGFEITLSPATPIHEAEVGPYTYREVAYVGDDFVFADGALRPFFPARDRPRVAEQRGLEPATGTLVRDGVAFTSAAGEIRLINRATTVTLKAAATPMRIAGSRHGSTLAVAVENRVLLYDLDALLPRFVPAATARYSAGPRFLDDHRVIYVRDKAWALLDLATGATTKLAELGTPRGITTPPDGSYFVVEDIDGTVTLARLDGTRAPIGTGFPLVAGSRVLFATDRTISAYDTTTAKTSLIIDAPGPLVRTTTRANETYVAFAVGTELTRLDLRSGSVVHTPLGKPADSIVLTPDGVVYAALGRDVWRWDGMLALHATAPRRIMSLGFERDHRPIAMLDSLSWFDPARGELMFPVRTTRASWGEDTDLAGFGDGKSISLFDLELRMHWPLATTEHNFALSPQATSLIVSLDDGFAIYRTLLPRTREAYRQWAVRQTNLGIGTTADAIVWP